MDFESFFQAATGRRPYGYQARIARDGLPAAVTAPTGTGKTGVILAWLWRLLYGPGPAVTPRRLVCALPPGRLAENAAAPVRDWLDRLELTEQVALHVVMGPWGEDRGDWRENMHLPAIVIGNTDVVVSKALNRGYGIGRALSPIDFALVTNGAQWVVDEAPLCPQATATLGRLAGWAGEGRGAEPFGITLLSSLTDAEPIVIPRLRGIERAARLADITASGDKLVITARVAEAEFPSSSSSSSSSRPIAAIGREEFAELFDTTAEVDVSVYLLDGDDPDVEIAWATWTPGPDGAPDPEVRYPPAEYRCRVPMSDALRVAGRHPVWRFDRPAGRWLRLGDDAGARPQPLELLLVNAMDGGYDPSAGFDPTAPGPVPDCPELLTPDEITERSAAEALPPAAAPRPWQSLAEHSDQVRDQAAALLTALAPRVPADTARAVIVAAYLHDAGKAHPVWQDALCALAGESEAAAVAAGRPWAKSGINGRLEFAGGAGFRHELASLLLLDGPLAGLLAASPDPDLTRYLVLAHHGLLRVRVWDDAGPDVSHSPPLMFGLAHGTETPIPAIFGQPATTLVTDLAQFGLDGVGAWRQTVLRLLARYGPVTLAYLETIVRIADWRASGGKDLPA